MQKSIIQDGKVLKDKQEVELTALEYKILVMLFENKGKIITREQILSYIWDNEENFVNDNTLTVYIKRIREKIEKDPNKPEIIKTVRGLGYKIERQGRNDRDVPNRFKMKQKGQTLKKEKYEY